MVSKTVQRKITEQPSHYNHLERMSVGELLQHINDEDHLVAEAVSKAMAHDSMQVCAKVKEIEDAGLRMRFCGKNAMDMEKEIARL